MDKQKLITRTLIGAGIVVIAYQLYKWGTKPKDPTNTPPKDTKKSSAEGKVTTKKPSGEEVNTKAKRDEYIKTKGYSLGEKRYDDRFGKVFTFYNDDNGARWILVGEQNQPKTMEWFMLNNKWYWSDWKNKLVSYDGKRLDYWRDKYKLSLPEDKKKVVQGGTTGTSKPSF